MRLNELYESEQLSSDELKIKTYIEKYCTDILSVYHSSGVYSFLYRGIKNPKAKAFVDKSREDRRPSHSTMLAQINMDKLLINAGFTALRSNSIFCTPSFFTAFATYSNKVYAIFPLNGFSFTWSPKVSDFYTNNLESKLSIPNAYLDTHIFDQYDYKNDNMIAALNSGNEILIHGKYVALEYAEYSDLIKAW